MEKKFGLAIHGGAGVILKSKMTSDLEKAYKEALCDSLKAGYDILKSGGTSLDAVIAAIKVMEDCPLFNAGKGSVFNHDGVIEMDAGIMDGKNLMAGAVAGVKTIKNPILAAHTVMTKSRHVLMMGEGAEMFAKLNDLQIEDPSYFFTQKRWDQLQKVRDTEFSALDHNIYLDPSKEESKPESSTENKSLCTVGAVALDIFGDLAAGTSTGGMTNKKHGRVGGVPIVGAATYANNKTCALSFTGVGEFIMRTIAAYDISAMMEYKGLGLDEAANVYIKDKLTGLGGDGGCVGIDANRNVTMPFNTEGMYRGYILEDGEPKVFIYVEKNDLESEK